MHLSDLVDVRVTINGQANDQISALDRGLLYGHTVFETVAVVNGKPRLINEHLERLSHGAKTLGIPLDRRSLDSELDAFCSAIDNACVRITLSIGPGGRGYQSPEKPEPLRVLSQHALPSYSPECWRHGIELGINSIRLANQPRIAGIKHGNRLEQILARQDWPPEWHEALMLDNQGHVVEATAANLFVETKGRLLTPDLAECGVAGVMRDYVIRLAGELGIQVATVSLSLPEVQEADAVFLTNSLIGVWPVQRFGERRFSDHNTAHLILKKLRQNELIPHY